MAIEIIATLSKSQYSKIISGQCTLEVPYGVSLNNKAGSRNLYLTCDDKEVYQELIDGLDTSGISWQEAYGLEDAL